MRVREEIAAILLDLQAVSLSVDQPFTWASGLRSPIYCDNRLIISTLAERRHIRAAFLEGIAARGWHADLIAGTATAGIPHAAWLAEALDLPMVYVRASEKKHGKRNTVEGRISAGQKTILIEDLISTAGSVVTAAEGLREGGARVLGVAAIFSYGLPVASNRLSTAGLDWFALADLETLLAVAAARGDLSAEHLAALRIWRTDPAAWSAAYISREG